MRVRSSIYNIKPIPKINSKGHSGKGVFTENIIINKYVFKSGWTTQNAWWVNGNPNALTLFQRDVLYVKKQIKAS